MMYKIIKEVWKEMIEKIREERGEGGINEEKEINKKFEEDYVEIWEYGLRKKYLMNNEKEFRKYGRKLIEKKIWREIEKYIVIIFNEVDELLKMKLKKKEVIELLRRMKKEEVKYREKKKVKRNDFMKMLINLKKKEEDVKN